MERGDSGSRYWREADRSGRRVVRGSPNASHPLSRGALPDTLNPLLTDWSALAGLRLVLVVPHAGDAATRAGATVIDGEDAAAVLGSISEWGAVLPSSSFSWALRRDRSLSPLTVLAVLSRARSKRLSPRSLPRMHHSRGHVERTHPMVRWKSSPTPSFVLVDPENVRSGFGVKFEAAVHHAQRLPLGRRRDHLGAGGPRRAPEGVPVPSSSFLVVKSFSESFCANYWVYAERLVC